MKSYIANKQLRDFGFLIGFFMPIIFGWLLPALRGHDFQIWTLFIGIPAIALGILKPILLFYPYKLWMKIGYVLGWINSRIILGMVFLIILVPIAIIMRILGHDPLRTKKVEKKSYKEEKTNYMIDLKKIF